MFGETVSDREKALHSYIQLDIFCNAPVSCVESDYYRQFSKFESTFSRKYVTEIFHELVRLVEKNISSEVKKTKAAFMHDSWTSAGIHYVGLFGLYVRLQTSTLKLLDHFYR